MAGSAKITTACDIEIAVDRDFLERLSNKSVCNPEQRRKVGGSGDKAFLPGGRRFFDFAQNDSCFARNDIGALGMTIFYTLLRRPFLDTLQDSARRSMNGREQ